MIQSISGASCSLPTPTRLEKETCSQEQISQAIDFFEHLGDQLAACTSQIAIKESSHE